MWRNEIKHAAAVLLQKHMQYYFKNISILVDIIVTV